MGRGTRTALTVAVAVLLVAGVGAAFTLDTDSASSVRRATLGLLERVVDVKAVAAADYTTGRDGQPIAAGDHIRTGTPGFATVDYPDGSVTRLGPATEFTVVALTDDTGTRQIRTRLDVGDTWHRVEKLTGTETFEVDTPVGTAAVRGTTFMIRCPTTGGCEFTVVDGTIRITTTRGQVVDLATGQRVVVDGTGEAAATTNVSAETLRTDTFAQTNQALDQGATYTDATATATTTPPRPALIVVSGNPMRTVDPDTAAVNTMPIAGENPAWSKDRRYLAYDRGGDVFIANADGTNERALVTGPETDTDPTWNPDGTAVAFQRANRGLLVVAADGSGLRDLVEDSEAVGPEWSPDGSRVAFTRFENFAPRLFFAPVAGGATRSTEHYVYDPDWSPDGASLATGGRGVACSFGVFRLDLATGAMTDIVPRSCSLAEGAVWSPDGRRLAYVGEPPPPAGQQGGAEGPDGLRIVDADGTDNRLLVELSGAIDW